MISSEVERTLVKSPPELWTELSNPDTLARHLGEFGEIRITRIEPEHEVGWVAGDTAGTVRIKPSGWGTKVTLTASREITASEPPAAVELAPEPPVATKHALDSGSPPAANQAIELKPGPTPEPEPNVVANTTVGLERAPAEPDLKAEPSRGFFARLFGGRRRRKAADDLHEVMPAPQPPQPTLEQPDPFAAVREALSPEPMTIVNPFSMPHALQAEAPDERETRQPPEHTADISADLKAAEEVACEQVTAVLTSVLDRLGAAHHRPFSRA